MRVAPAVAIILMGLVGCQAKPETPEQATTRMQGESAAAKAILDSLAKEFATHLNAGHADVVAGYYSEDAVAMPPNMPAATGRKAIQDLMGQFIAMKAQLTLMPQSVVANGPLATERGTYTLIFTPPGATKPENDTGKYLVHWTHVGGKWLLTDDIWNSDLPAMPMPAGKP